MVDEGDDAPTFTAPLADGGVGETFSLEDRLTSEAPIVLAFFPGAFTAVCTNEMNTLDDRLAAFEDAGATVYGVSVDSPFSLNEFRDTHDISFDFISDHEKEIIDAYDLSMDFAELGIHGLAQRAVFVIEADGTVSYAWVADDPTNEPDYAELTAAAASA